MGLTRPKQACSLDASNINDPVQCRVEIPFSVSWIISFSTLWFLKLTLASYSNANT